MSTYWKSGGISTYFSKINFVFSYLTHIKHVQLYCVDIKNDVIIFV